MHRMLIIIPIMAAALPTAMAQAPAARTPATQAPATQAPQSAWTVPGGTAQQPAGVHSSSVHGADASDATTPTPTFSYRFGEPSAVAQAPAAKGNPQAVQTQGQVGKGLDLTGDYKALDFWAKLKLGSAYYVNPQAVRETNVVYSYAPETFVASGKSPELWVLAHDGKVTFGIPDKPTHSIRAVPITVLSVQYKIDNPADLKQLLPRAMSA